MDRVRKKSAKSGLPPGTLVHIGEIKMEEVKISIIEYDAGEYREFQAKGVEECAPFRDTPQVSWINIDGIHQVERIEKIGKYFNLHPLLLEDIMNTEQRPKMEDFNEVIFIVLKMITYNRETDKLENEQVSLVLGPNFVLSFQEREGDVFNPIRERIRKDLGRIRKMGADYLAYTLIDAIVDNYFLILELIGEQVEDLEEELVTKPTADTMKFIHRLKQYMILLRKSIWPLRELVSSLERSESQLIHESTGIYLKDIYDHTIQVIDTIESLRDTVSGLLDIYLSSISNRMNEVMKILTIIATIFIPLTFVAGIYGMNFKYMPELDWRWGYPFILVIMGIIGILMGIYFKKKRWL